MASLILARRLLPSCSGAALLLLRCRQLRPVDYRSYADAKPRNENTGLLHIDSRFETVVKDERNKATFLEVIDHFKKRSKNDRGHVEFIYTALNHMKEYNLHKDLDVYKALLNIFPKGPLKAKNVYQKIFLHYPHQQNCCVRVLDEMEWNSVYPDKEVFDIVVSVFGGWAFATKKIRRMMYWYPRFRYLNKYLDRKLQEDRHMDLSFVERARMALEMMSRDKGAEVTYATVSDDKSLVISAQSPLQRRLIQTFDPSNTCYYVNGPFLVYVAEKSIKYVTFTTDPGPDSERLLDKFIDHVDLEDVYKTKFWEGPFEEQPENGTIHEQICSFITTTSNISGSTNEKLNE